MQQLLRIDEVIVDEGLYPRNGLNWLHAHDYAESMRCGVSFPPIVVARIKKKFFLVDGRHRLEAYNSIGEEYVTTTVLKGLTKKEIYIEAVKRNITHGIQFSPYEKRVIAVTLQNLEVEKVMISKILQIRIEKIDTFVGGKLTNTITGEEIVLKAPLGHLAGEFVPDDIPDIQKSLSCKGQVALLNQFLVLLDNNLLDFSDMSIKEKVIEIYLKLNKLEKKFGIKKKKQKKKGKKN